MQRRVQRPRDHRDPVRVCRLVVGNDQDLGAVDARELERAYARRVAAEDVETAAFGLGGACRAQCDNDHRHAYAGKGLDERARRVAIARDDDVVLQVGQPGMIVRYIGGRQILLASGPCGEPGAEREQKRHGITPRGVSPVTQTRLPGPCYDSGCAAPVGRPASVLGCFVDCRHEPPAQRSAPAVSGVI